MGCHPIFNKIVEKMVFSVKIYRAHDCGLPVELIVSILGASGTVGRWVFPQIYEFLRKELKGEEEKIGHLLNTLDGHVFEE